MSFGCATRSGGWGRPEVPFRLLALALLATICAGCGSSQMASADPQAIIGLPAWNDLAPTVGIDSGDVYINTAPMDGHATVIPFMSSPPPYVVDTPEQILVAYDTGLTWIDLDAPDSTSVRMREYFVQYDDPPTSGVRSETSWYFYPGLSLLNQEGPSLRPEGRRNHWVGFNARWRRRSGPWYEILFDATEGTYLWVQAGPGIVAYSWDDLFEASANRVSRKETFPSTACDEGGTVIGETNATTIVCFTQPIYTERDTTSVELVPRRSPLGCNLQVLQRDQDWLEVSNLTPECPNWNGDGTSPNIVPLFESGWIRWHDGQHLLIGFDVGDRFEQDGILF